MTWSCHNSKGTCPPSVPLCTNEQVWHIILDVAYYENCKTIFKKTFTIQNTNHPTPVALLCETCVSCCTVMIGLRLILHCYVWSVTSVALLCEICVSCCTAVWDTETCVYFKYETCISCCTVIWDMYHLLHCYKRARFQHEFCQICLL